MPSRPTIFVDVHEQRSGIPGMLVDIGADVRVQSLKTGDYIINGRYAIERKTVRDLEGALLRGRLWGQLGALRSTYSRCYLLFEGRISQARAVHPNALRGALLAVLDQRISVIQSEDRLDSAQWLLRLAIRASRSRRDRPVYAQRPKRRGQAETSEAMLSAIPGISSTSARALLDRFGSVSAVLAASPNDWQDVIGIGPVRSKRLHDALNHSQHR